MEIFCFFFNFEFLILVSKRKKKNKVKKNSKRRQPKLFLKPHFMIFKQVWLISPALFTIFSIEFNVFGKMIFSHMVTEKCK